MTCDTQPVIGFQNSQNTRFRLNFTLFPSLGPFDYRKMDAGHEKRPRTRRRKFGNALDSEHLTENGPSGHVVWRVTLATTSALPLPLPRRPARVRLVTRDPG